MTAIKDQPLVYYPRIQYKKFNSVLRDLFERVPAGISRTDDNVCEDDNWTLRFESHRFTDERLNKEWKVNYPSYNLLSRWRIHLRNDSKNFITHLDLDSALPTDVTAKALYIRLVCSLSKLRILSLRNNQLTHHEFTSHIGCLSHLIELQLAMNHMTMLPYGIKFCRQLCVLGLENNQFAALPYFLRGMPELHTVRRLGNNFNDSYINLRAAMESRLRPIRTSHQIQVPSLFQLAEAKVFSTGVVFGEAHISDYILERVCSLSSLSDGSYPCDICHKTPLQSPLSLIIFPELFIGIPMPPVCAIVCDLPCARIANQLSFEFSSVPPAAMNVVGVGRRSTRTFQTSGERENRRERLNVSRLFCGCIRE